MSVIFLFTNLMIAWNCSSLGSISEDIQSLISMAWFKTWLPLSNKLCFGVAIFIANGIRSCFYLSFCCTQTIVKVPFDFRWWIPKQWSLHILFSKMYQSTFSFRHVTQIYRHNKLRGMHNRSSKRNSRIVLLL